jgi:ribonuclease HI
MHLAINKVCARAAIRFATLPTHHPLYPHTKRAAKKCPKKFPSPLHRIMDTYKLHPDSTKSIQPVRQTPKWTSAFKIRIAPSKEQAMEEETGDSAFIRLYSDGSGIEGNIGSAAVLYRRKNSIETKHVMRYYLGPKTKHTVYEGEIASAIMSQELLHEQLRGFGRHVSMYVDNQASILATQTKARTSGYYLLDILHIKLTRNKRKFHNLGVTIRWIPSHLDIEGNEEADRQAKRAAKGDANSPRNRLPREFRDKLPDSRSAIQQAINKAIKSDTAHHLHKAPQWRKLRHIDPTMPLKCYRTMADSLPRKQASLLIQLRTGHAPLNKHLFNTKSADSPICPACEDAHETVHHFLLSCPVYEPHHRQLFYTLNRGSRSLLTLLSHPKATKPLFKYISKTGRFKHTLGDLELPDHLASRRNENNSSRNWILDLLNRPLARRRGIGTAPGREPEN